MKEDKEDGRVSTKVFRRVIKGAGGLQTMFFIFAFAAGTIYPNFLISLKEKEWGNQYFPTNPSQKSRNNSTAFNLIILSTLALGLANFFKALLLLLSMIWIGRSLHSKMVFRVLHSSTTNFLQRTPVGVIINRFSSDINNVDNNFSGVYLDLTFFIFGLLSSVVGLLYGIDQFVVMIPLFVFMAVATWINGCFLKAQREVTRLTLISKSPVIGLQSSSVAGGPQIRCQRLQGKINQLVLEKVEDNSKNFLLYKGLPYWFDYRMLLCQTFLLEIPLYVIMGVNTYYNPPHDGSASALVNFLLTVIAFAPDFTSLLKQTQNLEINAMSFERCFSYEGLAVEEGYRNLNIDFESIKKSKIRSLRKRLEDRVKKDLFSAGEIRFDNVSAWYPTSERKNIDGLSLTIKAGEKVGVVGRSGAGKSTFMKLIWRVMEPQEGEILVDGFKIREVDLKEYREQLNVVLQKPNIFSGTIASNISPNPLTVAEIQRIRQEMIDLGFPQSKLSDGALGLEIDPSSNDLSSSQKQVICLMQALQRQSQIVLMDEATAFLDPRMEQRFNQKIFEAFEGSTMIIIAHKLQSVMACDRILVFEDGKIAEDGAPSELLQRTEGLFYKMWSKEHQKAGLKKD